MSRGVTFTEDAEKESMRDSSSSELGTKAVSGIRRRFLFAHWEGGGNTPPTVAIVRRLMTRGHDVRVLGDACNREEFEATGAMFIPWVRIPLRRDKSAESDPVKDWEVVFPLSVLARVRDRLFIGPSWAYALDVLSELERFQPDAIVTSEMLLGVMAAAERAGIPCAVLSPNIYLLPLPGVPPFGPGFLPAEGLGGRVRDILVERLSLHIFGRGTGAFNKTRSALGLRPLAHPFEQAARIARHLVLTSTAFDFPATSLPKHVVYTGPELDDPAWAEPWNEPWSDSDRRPLIVVGFSSTFQNQAPALIRVIRALSTLNTRAVLTVGPALDTETLPRAPNVHVCRSAPHSRLLPKAAMMITHGGHGTVIRSLAAGVPLICMPFGRDQNDNAARVVARGAGLRVSRTAGVRTIRKAVLRILESPSFRASAQRLGKQIAHDAQHSSTLHVLEEVAARGRLRV